MKMLICDRMRPLMLYLLIQNGMLSETILLTTEDFSKKIKKTAFKEVITYNENSSKYCNIILRKLLQLKLKIKLKNKMLEISEVYGQRHILGMGMHDLPFIGLEDGLQDYEYKGTFKKKMRELFFNIPTVNSRRIKMYIYTGLNNKFYYSGILKKVKITTLWEKLTNEEKTKILELFNVNILKIKNIKESVLVITQPLSEDKIITEKKKIDMYKEIIESIKDYNIILKPHPREKTDYSKYIKNIEVLNKNFPCELLLLMKIFPKRVVTFYSSVANDFLEEGVAVKFYKKDSIIKK